MSIQVAYQNYSFTDLESPPYSLSHTIPASLNDSLLLVFTDVYNTVITVTAATWQGNPLTLLDSYNSRGSIQRIYYYLNPGAGSGTLSFTLSANTVMTIGAITLSNVNRAAPFGTVIKDNTANNGISLAVPPDEVQFRIGNVWIAGYYGNPTVGSGQTRIYWGGVGGANIHTMAASYKIGGTNTLSESGGGDKQMVGFVVYPSIETSGEPVSVSPFFNFFKNFDNPWQKKGGLWLPDKGLVTI